MQLAKRHMERYSTSVVTEIESEIAQSCPTLCDPMDCSLPGSSVHGILQARILSGLPFPSPGDLPNPGFEPRFPALQADALTTEPPEKPQSHYQKSLHTIMTIVKNIENNKC